MVNWQDHLEFDHWFDSLLKRVRNMRSIGLTDNQIVTHLVESKEATPEQVWLCIKSAEILEKSPE